MPENDSTIILNAFPTPKEQVISGLIGIGITAGAFLVIGGGFWVGAKIAEKIEARKDRKIENQLEK